MNQQQTIQELIEDTQALVNLVNSEFQNLTAKALNQKSDAKSWSILECLEHLNRYCDYYLPLLKSAIANAEVSTLDSIKIGWLGKKSINSVSPENATPIKTFKRMNPTGSDLTQTVIDQFLEHQATVLDLLSSSTNKDLNKKSIRIEFAKYLKLRTGETLLFLIRHQQRHAQQAIRVKALFHTGKTPILNT